jgi:hypothetical protein
MAHVPCFGRLPVLLQVPELLVKAQLLFRVERLLADSALERAFRWFHHFALSYWQPLPLTPQW